MTSQLDIDDYRLGTAVPAIFDAARCCVRVRVMEDLHRLDGPDLQPEPVTVARVTDADTEAIGVRAPDQPDLQRAGQPPGKLSRVLLAFVSRHPRTAAPGDGPWARGGRFPFAGHRAGDDV